MTTRQPDPKPIFYGTVKRAEFYETERYKRLKITLTVAFEFWSKTERKMQISDMYYDITLWGDDAERLKDKITDGLYIGVRGLPKIDTYQKDGEEITKKTVVLGYPEVDEVYLAQTLGAADEPFA